jgi:hypothetical protein
MKVKELFSNYLPYELIKENQKKLFNVLFEMLHQEGVAKDPVVDQLFGLIASEDQYKKCVEWLQSGHI